MVLPKNYDKNKLLNDIVVGIIIALVSIPISMGYAQIAGLPVKYGLYGSLFPVLVFAISSSSTKLVFGVDAAPAALCGALVSELGIALGSEKAIKMVPAITFVVCIWLAIFMFFKAGKFVKFISEPVMGGFLSGIGCTIILMQVPKLFGGKVGTGEVIDLIKNIVKQGNIGVNKTALILGITTILLIRIFASFFPRVPMAVIAMFIGIGLVYFFNIDKTYNIVTLDAVESGLPSVQAPEFKLILLNGRKIIMSSFTIALVILAESLLTTNSYANKYDQTVSNNTEIFSYSIANLTAAFTGCCPVSGSVSRTGIADQFKSKSQVMSVVAVIAMGAMLLYGTGMIAFMPVPILTGIVISALMGICEFDLAWKLRRVDKVECLIFFAVFGAVMFMGTIYGVLVGLFLSFVTFVLRESSPERTMLGCIENHEGFYTIGRISRAKYIENVAIYRFLGSLFFANIGLFQADINKLLSNKKIKVVIIDASGIGNIDVTAAKRLLSIYEKFIANNKKFYLCGHSGKINDQLRDFGAGKIIQEGCVKMSIDAALDAAGISRPFKLVDSSKVNLISITSSDTMAEFEWAYGYDADEKMEDLADSIVRQIVKTHDFDAIEAKRKGRAFARGYWDAKSEEELLDRVEEKLDNYNRDHKEELDKEEYTKIEETIVKRHIRLYEKIRGSKE